MSGKEGNKERSKECTVFINENGIYNYTNDICVGLNWDSKLILEKYNDYYFVTKESRLMAIIPLKAFSNQEHANKFINKLENYINRNS